jgi:hypothetical protein
MCSAVFAGHFPPRVVASVERFDANPAALRGVRAIVIIIYYILTLWTAFI